MAKYNATSLRRVSEQEVFPSFKDRGITMLLVAQDGRITQARTVEEKRTLLTELSADDCLLAAWTGQRYTDIFLVDLPRHQVLL